MTAATRHRRLLRAPVVVALVVLTVVFVYPLVWLLSASLKPRGEIFDNRLIPQHPTLENRYSEDCPPFPTRIGPVGRVLRASGRLVARATVIAPRPIKARLGLRVLAGCSRPTTHAGSHSTWAPTG